MTCNTHNWIKIYDDAYECPGDSSVRLPGDVELAFTCDECGEWRFEWYAAE